MGYEAQCNILKILAKKYVYLSIYLVCMVNYAATQVILGLNLGIRT